MRYYFRNSSVSSSIGNRHTSDGSKQKHQTDGIFQNLQSFFFYGFLKQMQLGSELALFTASADGVFDCLLIIVLKPGTIVLAWMGVDSQLSVTFAQYISAMDKCFYNFVVNFPDSKYFIISRVGQFCRSLSFFVQPADPFPIMQHIYSSRQKTRFDRWCTVNYPVNYPVNMHRSCRFPLGSLGMQSASGFIKAIKLILV